MAKHKDTRDSNFDEKVVQVSRVSKKTKGGNKVGFSVLMVVGDHQGQVGVGLGKAPDVLGAIKKGVRKAKKKMFTVPMDGTTIPFAIEVTDGASTIILKPAPRGTGVVAGGAVRAVVDAAGIRDISSKIVGTDNKASNVYTTFKALQQIRQLVDKKGIKLKSIAQEEKELKAQEQEQQRLAAQKAKQDEAKSKAAGKGQEAKAKKAPAKKAAAKKESAKKSTPADQSKAGKKDAKQVESKSPAAEKKATKSTEQPVKKEAEKPVKKAVKSAKEDQKETKKS